MARSWTEQQKNAIIATGGSVLVSAAAGSGKTAVLVERVIRRITDENNPASADRFLIVTFTRAAAAEMRQRISDALESLIRQQPYNKALIRQQMLLPSAKICTIDSFCLDLVRENFQYLDIPADFTIADEGEIAVLSRQAMDMTMEKMHQTDVKGDFARLTELLIQGRDDEKITEIIASLYTTAMSFPFPEKWLDSLCEPYDNIRPITESPFIEPLTQQVRETLGYAISLSEGIIAACEGDEMLEKMFLTALTSDKSQYERILALLDSGDWDGARSAAGSFEAIKRGSKPRGMEDTYEILSFTEMRDRCKKAMKALPDLLCCSEEEYREDMEFFRPLVRCLVTAVKTYMEFFSGHKKAKKIAEFADISQMALSLLVRSTDEGWESTDFAGSYADAFDEILIDEYQDTNGAQDMLFTAISRDNLFRVGDVKQSIYRFRQANPDIFIGLKDAYPLYDRDDVTYPCKITLGKNFRSRRGVTDIINFIFSQIMSRDCGNVDYDADEELVFGAAYKEKEGPDTELHIIDTDGLDRYEDSLDKVQARYAAKMIRSMVESGYTVRDGNGERPATYGDFALLLRALGGGKGLCYADIFREEGVPTVVELPGKFLEAAEIKLMLNFLRIIDNPRQDIPLLGVLMSPVFGFTVDDVSDIRIRGKGKGFYSRLLSLGDEEKISGFLHTMREYRTLSVCLSVSDLVEEIYSRTGLPSVFDAIDPTGTKRSNLMLLGDYAANYGAMGYSSLSGFIRFMDSLADKKKDISGSVGFGGKSDAVKIMTIHKSKGLEFPVCILSGCATAMNKRDERENLLVSPRQGLGIIRRDEKTFEEFPTLCHNAVKLSIHRDNMSEELRVLYVAMTRAAEKLIMLYAGDNALGAVGKLSYGISRRRKTFTPYEVAAASSYGQWIIKALLRHPDAAVLREQAGIPSDIVKPCGVPLKVICTTLEEAEKKTAADTDTGSVDTKLLEEIRNRLDFTYQYAPLSGVMSKRAASETDKDFIDRDYFASSVPDFLSEGKLSGAFRGIATHSFMQYADYESASESVTDEIARLKKLGIISDREAEGINVRKVQEFFAGDLAGRILRSPLVMREKKFTIEIPLTDLYPDLTDFPEEKMIIQGIADCAFLEEGKLVVVDYKTDALDSEELFIEKYTSQVMLYKKALTLCTGYEVKETLLYSFHLGKVIAV